MALSLLTQEIMIAFSIENKDNVNSWGKYVLEELQDARTEMSEDERASTTGQRIINRIKELEHPDKKEVNVIAEEKVDDDRIKEIPAQRGTQGHDKKQRTQIIIGGVITVFIILLAGIYFS